MTSSLILGNFEFTDTEVPESLQFGGKQMLAVQKYIGGGKNVQSMGRDDAPLEWSGIFRGENALNRAMYLDGLRVAGNQLTFTWNALSYNVVISEFLPTVQRVNHIPYKITLEVVTDNTAPVLAYNLASIDDLIEADMITANELALQIDDLMALDPSSATLPGGLSGIAGAIKNVQSAIDKVGKFATAVKSTANQVLQPIAQAMLVIKTAKAQIENSLLSVATLGGIVPNNPIADKIKNISSKMDISPKLQLLSSVLGRVQSNVQVQTTGIKQITVSGTNLFALASKHYGDASAWTTIANANNITDPMITGIATLNLPTLPDNSGGVLNG